MAIAHVQQIPLANTSADEFIEIIDNLPSTYKPSILIDLENNRRLEVEAINGYISKLGRELNVDTPANDFVYACVKPHMHGTL